MNIAVLCPGPSLPRYWRPSLRHDLVIGVNTAGWKYRVDYLAFSDRHILEGLEFMPRIGFITHGNHALPEEKVRLAPLLYDARSNALTAELRALAAKQGMTECAWTFPNALAQANRWAGDGYSADDWREQIAWSLVAQWTGLHELPVALNCSHHDPAAAKALIVHEHGEKKWSRIA